MAFSMEDHPPRFQHQRVSRRDQGIGDDESDLQEVRQRCGRAVCFGDDQWLQSAGKKMCFIDVIN